MFFIRTVLEVAATLGFLFLGTGILARSLFLRREPSVGEGRGLLQADLLFWCGAVILAISKLVLWLSDVGFGTWFHLANPLQWLQIGLFAGILGLQIPMARVIWGWRGHLALEQTPWFTDVQHDRMLWLQRLQLVLLLLLPVLEPLLRQGMGLPR